MESIDIVRKQVAESERVKAELSKNEEVIAANIESENYHAQKKNEDATSTSPLGLVKFNV